MASMDRARALKESAFRGSDLRLFIRDVRNRQSRKRAIMVRSWSTIQDVKNKIQQVIHVPPSAQSLYIGPLLTAGGELPNHRTLHDAGIYRSGETLLLDIKTGSSLASSAVCSLRPSDVGDICISSSMIDSTPRLLEKLVQQARRGFLCGLKPAFVLDGSGGTYFLHDARKAKIAVFKPADEEPYSENNPRGYLPQQGQSLCLREGVIPGQSCVREVAAYLLDHEGFSGVPMTTLAEAHHPTAFNNNGSHLNVLEGGAAVGSHSLSPSLVASACKIVKKVGSFQEFFNSEFTMDDISPSKISVDEVHKIAILDIRIMNADRNAANLLCRRTHNNSLELIPIDHGFCLRTVGDVSWMDWCWLDWPQLKKPLSEKSKAYILNLDIEADARLLRERLNIATEAIDYFRASSLVLKAGVRAGLSLYEIACICCRNDNFGEIPSRLEMLFSMASELALSAIENGRWHHAAASSALAEQLSPSGGSLLNDKVAHAMHKSMSGVLFRGVFPVDDDIKQDQQESPGLIQSSASDSSSETEYDGVEKEDCEEWAATVIADVSLENAMPLAQGNRSCILEYEDSSDSSNVMSSPKGFWHKRPGSPSSTSLSSEEDDDDSGCWSQNSSTKLQSELYPEMHDMDVTAPSPFSLGKAAGNVMARRPTVSFAHIEPPQIIDMKEPGDFGQSAASSFRKVSKDSGLTRSLSYSALSGVKKTSNDTLISRPSPKPFAKEYDQYRDYFLKFVDLVIVRETTAATQNRQMNGF